MDFRPKTLSTRLFLLSSLVALIGVGVVAFVISTDYRQTAERRFAELLAANAYNLMGTVEIDDDGALTGAPLLGDVRYNQFESGWYWSVEKIDDPSVRLTSLSLADQSIEVPPGIPLDETFQRFFDLQDNAGQNLLGLEAQVILGESSNLVSFLITGNEDSLIAEVSVFRRRLAVILCIFALSMLFATYYMVRFGLRPLSLASDRLADIRAGKAESIDGEFPDEIQPLITETNALIRSNNVIVDRARTQVGNLAHSLKTPLAVMQNQVRGLTANSLMLEQLDNMQQQIKVYLDRARISARHSTSLARTEIAPALEKLAIVVGKLNPQTDIKVQPGIASAMVFEGEEHDFLEIFGNLFENAAKFSTSNVLISVSVPEIENGTVVIHVEDDGPGMTAKDIEQAKKRGSRVDEGGRGWGLGLSIVRDIVGEYEGNFELSRSELGGLRASVTLPGRLE